MLIMNMALLLLVLVFGTIRRLVIYIALPNEVPHPPGFLIEPIFFITLSEGDAKFNLVNGLLL